MRYAAAIFDIHRAESNETKDVLLVKNEPEEDLEIEEVISDIKEEISAVDFVNYTRDPKLTKNDLNVNNKCNVKGLM